MVKIVMRDGEVVLRPGPTGLTGAIRNVQIIQDEDDPCDEPCDCPEICTENCGNLIMPLAYDFTPSNRSGTGSELAGESCCCNEWLAPQVLMNHTRVFMFCASGDLHCRYIKGNNPCIYVPVDTNDYEIPFDDFELICNDGVTSGPITNPHISEDGDVYRAWKGYSDSGTGTGDCCQDLGLHGTPSLAPLFSCDGIITWVLQVSRVIEEGTGSAEDQNYAKFSLWFGSDQSLTYESENIPILADLDITGIGPITLNRTDATGTGTTDDCEWPESVTINPINAQGIVDRNLLAGTSGCSGTRKSCCERWGTQVELSVKPLECDLDPEDFILNEVSPAETPRRWTGTAAMSCGDTYAIEFTCDETADDCEDKFNLVFTPGCGDTSPITATILTCTCLEEPPTFTYEASRAGTGESDGCVCCEGLSPCTACTGDLSANSYQVDLTGFSGGGFCDCDTLNGTWIVAVRPAPQSPCRYFNQDVGCAELELRFTQSSPTAQRIAQLLIITASGSKSWFNIGLDSCLHPFTVTNTTGNCDFTGCTTCPESILITPLFD